MLGKLDSCETAHILFAERYFNTLERKPPERFSRSECNGEAARIVARYSDSLLQRED